ncbi:Ferredoxin 1 [Gracilaria domingensis]|nr:Ferredoxin 1 [Gracilaria domingensis]
MSPVKAAKVPYACASTNEEIYPEDIGQKRQQDYLKMLRDVTAAETALSNPLGTKMSHEIIKFAEDGLGPLDRYVYVEEQDCIGCTHCATTASNTFFLESMFGRARVFNQLGDSEELVAEAIDTCPVNCIYYVDWEDLVTLEQMRKFQKINNWTRLVGGQDAKSSKKGRRKTKVMDSGIMRCEDCPGRGCATCPLYGVGQNPEYLRKKAMREAKQQRKKEDDRKRARRRL